MPSSETLFRTPFEPTMAVFTAPARIKKPTTTTETVVGDTVYKTRTEAEGAMKTIKVCTSS